MLQKVANKQIKKKIKTTPSVKYLVTKKKELSISIHQWNHHHQRPRRNKMVPRDVVTVNFCFVFVKN
jgi:hypothetical protein